MESFRLNWISAACGLPRYTHTHTSTQRIHTILYFNSSFDELTIQSNIDSTRFAVCTLHSIPYWFNVRTYDIVFALNIFRNEATRKMQKKHTQTNRLHSEFLLKCLIYYMVHVRFMFIHWFDKIRYIFLNLNLLLGCWCCGSLFYAGTVAAFFFSLSLSFSIFSAYRMAQHCVAFVHKVRCTINRGYQQVNTIIYIFFIALFVHYEWANEWMNEWTLFSIYASLCHTCCWFFFSLARLSKQQATPHSTTSHHITSHNTSSFSALSRFRFYLARFQFTCNKCTILGEWANCYCPNRIALNFHVFFIHWNACLIKKYNLSINCTFRALIKYVSTSTHTAQRTAKSEEQERERERLAKWNGMEWIEWINGGIHKILDLSNSSRDGGLHMNSIASNIF